MLPGLFLYTHPTSLQVNPPVLHYIITIYDGLITFCRVLNLQMKSANSDRVYFEGVLSTAIFSQSWQPVRTRFRASSSCDRSVTLPRLHRASAQLCTRPLHGAASKENRRTRRASFTRDGTRTRTSFKRRHKLRSSSKLGAIVRLKWRTTAKGSHCA